MTGQQQWQLLGLGREPEPWLNQQERLEPVAVGRAQRLAVADMQHRYYFPSRTIM